MEPVETDLVEKTPQRVPPFVGEERQSPETLGDSSVEFSGFRFDVPYE